MKKIAFFLLFTTVFSCSKNEEELPSTEIIITNISPKRVKQGDTITITGKNLHKGFNANFSYYDKNLINYSKTIDFWSFLTKSDIKATFRVPELFHESIILKTTNTELIDIDYHGVINLKHNLNLTRLQIITDKLAYATDGKQKLYVSNDGCHTWQEIYSFPKDTYISSFFFLSNNDFWVCINDYTTGLNNVKMYHSNNLVDFNLSFKINGYYSKFRARKIKFFSNNSGYFVNDNQEMFFSNGSSYQDIYDYYPGLNNLPFGIIELYDFTAINENLIFLAPNNSNNLIKIDHGQVSYTQFNSLPSAPQFFDNIGYVKVGNQIHKSEDFGNTWNKIYEGDFYNINFFTKDIGVTYKSTTLNHNPYKRHDIIFRTVDGGKNWVEHSLNKSKYIAAHSENDPINYSWLISDKIKYIE